MSFITNDYRCMECDEVEERFVRRSEVDEQKCECGADMKQLIGAPTTTFKFHDRSAQKGKKAVSLRDPQGSASSKGHAHSLD